MEKQYKYARALATGKMVVTAEGIKSNLSGVHTRDDAVYIHRCEDAHFVFSFSYLYCIIAVCASA